jgi:hypothetical protein
MWYLPLRFIGRAFSCKIRYTIPPPGGNIKGLEGCWEGNPQRNGVWSNIDPQLISDQSTPLSDVKLVAGPRLKEPRGGSEIRFLQVCQEEGRRDQDTFRNSY